MKHIRNRSGFTIVELLIVIVIIGILAGITIVSYSGVTARARLATAQATATTVKKKIELYNIEKGTYPTTSAQLSNGAAIGTTYFLSGVEFAGAAPTSAPSAPATVYMTRCDSTDGSVGGLGNQIIYWDPVAGSAVTVDVGVTTACAAAV